MNLKMPPFSCGKSAKNLQTNGHPDVFAPGVDIGTTVAAFT
jgi:hypothetical protein